MEKIEFSDKVTLYQGDCRDVLKELPEGSVHCCVTSPPYFNLRDYKVEGQIGLEATPDEYVAAMVGVFRDIWRVLRDDGTCWINLGDSYAASRKDRTEEQAMAGTTLRGGLASQCASLKQRNKITPGFKPKDLIGQPWMLAFALRDDGWYLRQDIIWHKPNPMPESVTDRCTKAHEYIFLLSKKPRYFFDADAMRERTGGEVSWEKYKSADGHNMPSGTLAEGVNVGFGAKKDSFTHPAGRNKRSVWTVATAPYKEAHYATFPPKLIEPCIMAGTSEEGCCPECGTPWERVVEKTPMIIERSQRGAQIGEYGRTAASGTMVLPTQSKTIGWKQACKCDGQQTTPCTVLDPFAGTGTTAEVAAKLGRHAILIELNPRDIELQKKRLAFTEQMTFL